MIVFSYGIDTTVSSIKGSTAVSINAVKPSYTPSADEMNFDFITRENQKISVSIENPDLLWNDPKFNRNWNVTLVITGWNSNINRTNIALDVLYQAYRQREVNFVVSIAWFL